MKELGKVFQTGTHLSVSVNTPCGYTLIEGAVVAKTAHDEIRIVLPSAVSPKMDHIPVGTQVFLSRENGSDLFAYNGLICSHNERPFIRVKVFERMPAMEKRQHRRISVHLPMYCSVVDNNGSFTVIHDGKKVNGKRVPADLSLSAGGFRVKTPFPVEKDTMAVVVFIYPDEAEHVLPVLSTSVYSYPSTASKNFLTGFKFSLINEHDRRKIDNLVNEILCAKESAHRTRKFPSCLARIRNL
ncbi:MAG: hypothetical protein FD174_2912 [Geobacteraceae bacterium]|nr:MAG: hypothetical protein FD174_2912 [Geobacteraceae bacterium]